MNEKSVEKVVIIGSGPAGWSAAIYAARAALNPLVFEGALTAENQDAGTLPMGQLTTTTEVENYPGFPSGDLRAYLKSALAEERLWALPSDDLDGDPPRIVSGAALVELMRRQAENFGARVVSEDVTDVDLSVRPFTLVDSSGVTTRAETVIVATGASTRWLGLASEERFKNNGVSACAVCDGASPRFRDQPIVVVGGGDVAVEDAEYLSKFASKVYIVHRRDELRAAKILVERIKRNPKVEFVWNSVVADVLGDDAAGVQGVLVADASDPSGARRQIAASGLFVAIGRRPNVGFLKGALELTSEGVIKRPIPFSSATSVPGVFVAGDVCDARYRQAIVASSSGACAALDAERFLLENPIERR